MKPKLTARKKPLGSIFLGAAILLWAAPGLADHCAVVQELRSQGLGLVEISRGTGIPLALVRRCERQLRRAEPVAPPVRPAPGPSTHGAPGPPPFGAAGPAPFGAAGPPPSGTRALNR